MTFFPLVLGVFGASVSAIEVLHELGNNGYASPAPLFAYALDSLLTRLLVGAGLTCLFLPLGILTLVVRRPK